MNDHQRKLLIAVATTVVAMLLFPPFRVVGLAVGRSLSVTAGYSARPNEWASVDVGLLLTQWAAVLIVGAIAYFLFKK
jgi:hypothetical protein